MADPQELFTPKAPKLQEAPKEPKDSELASPPHAIGPEKSILSSMLQNPEEYIGQAIEQKLTASHFYLPSHGKLFGILEEHFEQNKQVELVALSQYLLDRGLLESMGGPAAITEIYTYAPTTAHFASHLEIVKEKHVLRSVIHSCTQAITNAYDDPEDVQIFLDHVEQQVLEIRENAESGEEESIKETVAAVMKSFEEFLAGDRGTAGLKTGYQILDEMTNGLKATEMFVIAARPSMGKTSFMMNVVEHIAIDLQQPCMVFSCEMGSEQIVQRLVFSRARFPHAKLQSGYQPSKEDLRRIQKSSLEIAGSKLFIDDTAAISINDLRAKARRKHRDCQTANKGTDKEGQGLGLIAIDYLQLMRSTSRQASNSREREIAEISAGLKALAKELNVPVIVLAQLNRGPESRTGSSLGVPRMSDLRESGSIEQDADMVGLLYRKAYYLDNAEEKEEDDGESELVLAKNRNGATGNIALTFLAPLMRFETRSFKSEPQ